MGDEPKERVITFRVTEEQYLRIDECGFRAGRSVNEWCRDLVVSEASQDFGMTANQRIVIEEIAVLRKMLGVLASRILSPEEMEELREHVSQHYEEYGQQVLAKRSRFAADHGSEETD